MSSSRTEPVELPGVLLAAMATLGLGLVLGPEGPLIAASTALATLAVRSVRKDVPDQALAVLAASAAFAAIASVFGSPVVGAVVLIEAAGLGGSMLPLVLLPGLMSAGIGSLVFTGAARWTGLDSSDYALAPMPSPTSARSPLHRSPGACRWRLLPPWPQPVSSKGHAARIGSADRDRWCDCPPSESRWRASRSRSVRWPARTSWSCCSPDRRRSRRSSHELPSYRSELWRCS